MQASQFLDLPPALLTRILQAVPQQEHLSSCATVCPSWATAAAAATVDVDLSDATANVVAAFQPWLEQHGNQLVSLKLKLRDMVVPNLYSRFQPPSFTLPCSSLQQLSRLDLAGVKLQLETPDQDGSGSGSSTAPLLPKLQSLKLWGCVPSNSTLLQLAQCTGVTRLKLEERHGWRLLFCARDSPHPPLDRDAVKHLLQGLPNLSSLSLARVTDPPSHIPLLPAGSLTALTLRGYGTDPDPDIEP
jgi:hypothetical protein